MDAMHNLELQQRLEGILERILKQSRFKNLGELHKEWTVAGVSASRATTHRKIGYKCRIPSVSERKTTSEASYLSKG